MYLEGDFIVAWEVLAAASRGNSSVYFSEDTFTREEIRGFARSESRPGGRSHCPTSDGDVRDLQCMMSRR